MDKVNRLQVSRAKTSLLDAIDWLDGILSEHPGAEVTSETRRHLEKAAESVRQGLQNIGRIIEQQ